MAKSFPKWVTFDIFMKELFPKRAIGYNYLVEMESPNTFGLYINKV